MKRGRYDMSWENDFVMWALRLANATISIELLSTNALMQIEQDMRRAWGGKRVYIAKRARGSAWIDAGRARDVGQ